MPALNVDLVLDVGNTRTKAALYQGETVLDRAVLSTGDMDAVGRFLGGRTIGHIAFGSTAAPDESYIQRLGAMAPLVLLTGASPSPLGISYGTPHSLGADRLANAVAVLRRFPGRAALAVDLGTCITYDLVGADGVYRGGAISPGLHMRARAMHAYSARLPLVEPPEAPALVGTTTETSLAAGIHFGILGELQGYVRQLRKEADDLAVVLTGGDAPRFVRGMESGIFALPLLTLEGYHALLQHHLTSGHTGPAPGPVGGHGPGPTG